MLKDIKRKVKENPLLLFKKPYYLGILPMIIVRIVLNRWRSSESVIYLTISDVGEIQNKQTCNERIGEFIRIDEFEKFRCCLNQRIHEDRAFSISIKNVKSRFTSGDYAFVLTKGSEYLCYLFISEKTAFINQVHKKLMLPEKTFSIYDVYTFQKHRGKGYYKTLFYNAVNHMHIDGYHTLWLWLMKHNDVSIKTHISLGIHQYSLVLKRQCKYFFCKNSMKEETNPLSYLLNNGISHTI